VLVFSSFVGTRTEAAAAGVTLPAGVRGLKLLVY
jgi:hypothetical protein